MMHTPSRQHGGQDANDLQEQRSLLSSELRRPEEIFKIRLYCFMDKNYVTLFVFLTAENPPKTGAKIQISTKSFLIRFS